jgi:hypothetical protein
MRLQTDPAVGFDVFDPARPIRIDFSSAPLTSEAGLLPLRQDDERLRLPPPVAHARNDPRAPRRVEPSFLDRTRRPVFGLRAGDEDPNDPAPLRTEPVFPLITPRSPDDPPLARQPTRSRCENQIDLRSRKRLRDGRIDPFIASFETPPLALTFDPDAVDDPTPGAPHRSLFPGCDEPDPYFPLVVTAADTDPIGMLRLRPGPAPASRGADDDREYRVGRRRAVGPAVTIRVRGDGGFGNPTRHAGCDRWDILFPFGPAANRTWQRGRGEWRAATQRRGAETRPPQRRVDGFGYPAGTRTRPRWVIVPAEANARGTNRRFGTTNRSWSRESGEATDDA